MNKQAIDAVLFDLDGTLLDTAKDLGAALNAVLAKNGMPSVAYEQFRLEASNGSKGLLELGFGEAINDYEFEALKSDFLDIYHNNICVETDLFNGMLEVLESIRSEGLAWGIVTNKPGYLTTQLLQGFDELKDCAVCISGDSLPERKPSPTPLLHAAAAIDAIPGKTLYVGDALRDMQAANSAGMISVLARYGYLTKEELERDWDVDHQIETVSELLTLIHR